MKSNKTMKETIDKDFNQTENYLEILSKTMTHKKSNKYKIVLLCSCVFIVGIATFQYLPKGSSNNKDPYLLTSIFAEEKEYDSDEKIVFETKMRRLGDYTQFNEYSALYEGDMEYNKDGYRINLKITGENIDYIKYKVISDNDTIELCRGVSGELQYLDPGSKYPDLMGYDAYDHAKKIEGDLTQEEIKLLLELSGYENIQPEDLNDKQLFNLLYNQNLSHDNDIESEDNELVTSPEYTKENEYSKKWYEISKKSMIEADKIFGHFSWDFVENSKEITIPKEDLNANQVLYLAGVYGYNYKDPAMYDINRDMESLKQLARDMKIEIDIVYKDGTVKTKTLTYEFKDLGIKTFEFRDRAYEYSDYELQGTLQ